MIGRVVADYVDDRRRRYASDSARRARVMQIGEPVRQAWPQMQQGGGWLLCHAAVTIGHPGHRTFEKSEHGTHAPTLSSATTKCISDVPGLPKKSLDARPDERLSAPFSC